MGLKDENLQPQDHPSPEGRFEHTCPSHGSYIAKSGSGCPSCSRVGKQGDEMMKKIDDDNDLYK